MEIVINILAFIGGCVVCSLGLLTIAVGIKARIRKARRNYYEGI